MISLLFLLLCRARCWARCQCEAFLYNLDTVGAGRKKGRPGFSFFFSLLLFTRPAYVTKQPLQALPLPPRPLRLGLSLTFFRYSSSTFAKHVKEAQGLGRGEGGDRLPRRGGFSFHIPPCELIHRSILLLTLLFLVKIHLLRFCFRGGWLI